MIWHHFPTWLPTPRRTLWTMDEHRLGLKPIMRRVWTPPGQRASVPVEDRYEWLYVYGFVRPTTGQTFWLLLPTVSTAAFSIALVHFSRAVAQETMYLMLDRAGYHTSPRVQFPDYIRPLFQPAYSPELQPAEHLWPLVDQPVVNRHFFDIDALELTVIDQCCWLQDHPDIICSATCFHWWPKTA